MIEPRKIFEKSGGNHYELLGYELIEGHQSIRFVVLIEDYDNSIQAWNSGFAPSHWIIV